ncbi:MAG: hypothetical protein AB8F65_00900 [Woeseiaceae bacterium]
MRFSFYFLVAGLAVTSALSVNASASDQWQACDDCSVAARQQLATQLPPDQFATTVVNVIDRSRKEFSSFRVSVFYDSEFRQFFRFAIPVGASSDALLAFHAWRDFDAELLSLQQNGLQSSVTNAATWIREPVMARKAVDQQLAGSGLQNRLLEMGKLSQLVVTHRRHVSIVFADRSRVYVSVGVASAGLPVLHVLPVRNSLQDPSGLPLPEDERSLELMDQIGDNTQTEYLGGYIETAWQRAQWVRDSIRTLNRYRTTCSPAFDGSMICSSVSVG